MTQTESPSEWKNHQGHRGRVTRDQEHWHCHEHDITYPLPTVDEALDL